MEIRSFYCIETAERVPLTVELAGVGARVVAFIIDFWVMLCLLGLTMLSLSTFGKELILLGAKNTWVMESLNIIIPLFVLFFFFSYHFLQEWLWQGRSVGKALMKIRVVRNNGQPIGFWEAFGRNLLRLVDVYASGIGLFPMLISRSEKRFGDFLVGSVVIQNTAGNHWRPMLVTAETESSAASLAPQETVLLAELLRRRTQFFALERQSLEAEATEYFKTRTRHKEQAQENPDFLAQLLG